MKYYYDHVTHLVPLPHRDHAAVPRFELAQSKTQLRFVVLRMCIRNEHDDKEVILHTNLVTWRYVVPHLPGTIL